MVTPHEQSDQNYRAEIEVRKAERAAAGLTWEPWMGNASDFMIKEKLKDKEARKVRLDQLAQPIDMGEVGSAEVVRGPARVGGPKRKRGGK